jgi:hypothetical protein
MSPTPDRSAVIITFPGAWTADQRLAFLAMIEAASHAATLERLSADTVTTLLDLARAGQEANFRWFAASAGVKAEELDALWTGTVARVRA